MLGYIRSKADLPPELELLRTLFCNRALALELKMDTGAVAPGGKS